MGARDRGLLGATSVGDAAGAAVRAARKEAGLTVDGLALLVDDVRRRRHLPEIQHESVRRQLIGFESGHHQPGRKWRGLIATALRIPQEQLFGPSSASPLPRPLLLNSHITSATVESLLHQRAIHAETEHVFGPQRVHDEVARDMQVVLGLLPATPSGLRRDMHLVAASYAEMLGWLAQDSGDAVGAIAHTSEALEHLALVDGADTGLRAMVLMRRSSVVTTSDPLTAIEYAEHAAEAASSLPSGRLHATIARQQALAAFAAGEERDFNEHLAYALDLSEAEPAPKEFAIYATTGYVVSEATGALIKLGRADEAAERLRVHIDQWPDGQQRDHAVARLRLVRALTAAGDYNGAIPHVEAAVHGWYATPSQRARAELQSLQRVLRDRSRAHPVVALNELRGWITDALHGGSDDD